MVQGFAKSPRRRRVGVAAISGTSMGVSRMQSDAGWGWVRSLRSLREGVLLLLEGARFLRRERRLWALALIPMLFALFFVAVATSLFWVRLEGIHAFWVATLPVIEAGAWWSWSWVGPGRLLLWLLGWLAVLGSFAPDRAKSLVNSGALPRSYLAGYSETLLLSPTRCLNFTPMMLRHHTPPVDEDQGANQRHLLNFRSSHQSRQHTPKVPVSQWVVGDRPE